MSASVVGSASDVSSDGCDAYVIALTMKVRITVRSVGVCLSAVIPPLPRNELLRYYVTAIIPLCYSAP